MKTHPLTPTLCSALAAAALTLLPAPPLHAQEIAERLTIYTSAKSTPFHASVWKMKMQRAPGGLDPRGQCLWFNTDWQAQPWAGVRFSAQNTPPLKLTEHWITNGFIRLHINVTVDRFGNIGGGDSYQILPQTDDPKVEYQEMRSQFVDRGRGIDEVATTWQEVLVPLRYFTQLRAGTAVSGLNFQTRNQIQRAFSLDRIEFVRYTTLPDWIREQQTMQVMQEWVEWPAYADLPEVVKADRRPLSVRAGSFVTPDGQRAFMLNPYCREDPRLVYGIREPDQLPPTYDLYSREKHGWIYDEVPSAEHLCRLGFNSYSATPVPTAWWLSVGLQRKNREADDRYLADTLVERVNLPFYVDLVSWPYTMGAPGLELSSCNLPASAATVGRNHWTQYRTIGEGRKAWLAMWELNARRYRDAGARTLMVELLNEPAYTGESDDHHAEFEQWLKARYQSVATLNALWKTEYPSLTEAAAFRFDRKNTPDGQSLDYDEYLSGTMNDLIAAGVKSVTAILPDTLVGVQTMRGYTDTPRDSVWKYRLAPIESAVITPTGGGSWTSGSGSSHAVRELTSHPMAGAPLENDLLLALAGNKMIVDNEFYLRGQTRRELRDCLWEHVVCGLDGLTVFSWSKRGWVWRQDRTAVQTDADKYPYAALIPLARRTDALRGILDFSIEVQSLAPQILPKPWGPAPAIGCLYSWDNARRRLVDPALYNKLPAYYAALRNSHWNMTMLTADTVLADNIPQSVEVIVAGGITHAESGLSAKLRAFVERGGTLILGECDFTTDLYNNPLPPQCRLAPAVIGAPMPAAAITLPNSAALFPGKIQPAALHTITPAAAAEVTLKDAENHPVVIRSALGQGQIYYHSADLHGYALAALLHEILHHAAHGTIPAQWRSVTLTENSGHIAPNIIVSRRSYPDRHVVLLLNRDDRERAVTLSIPGITGDWSARDALTATAPQPVTAAGVVIPLPAAGPAAILFEKP